jgi:hypothetical protein
MPAGFHNRRADNWRPLLAIAELAGGEWPARAREAALALTGGSDQVTREVEILSAIRSIFLETCATKFAPQELCEAVNRWSKEHDLDILMDPKSLSKLLKNFFQIEKKPMRIEGSEKTVRGYAREDFEDAFARYLPPATDPSVPDKT